jgi:hypothetical protein
MFTASYDTETLGMLSSVFDAVWTDVQGMLGNPLDASEISAIIARRIMDAANEGERDPKMLKLIALRAIDA